MKGAHAPAGTRSTARLLTPAARPGTAKHPEPGTARKPLAALMDAGKLAAANKPVRPVTSLASQAKMCGICCGSAYSPGTGMHAAAGVWTHSQSSG